jgi:hypothetical protein
MMQASYGAYNHVPSKQTNCPGVAVHSSKGPEYTPSSTYILMNVNRLLLYKDRNIDLYIRQ